MSNAKPESPLTMEEVLLRHGWVIYFKDADVCSLVNPKDKTARPICIPQNPGPNGLSSGIVQTILFDARIDEATYLTLLDQVKASQERAKSL